MIGISALIDAITSHASATGLFDSVQGHEPKSAPGNGLTCAVFVANVGPARTGSGLATTTVRVELTARIYKPFISQPEDLIDPGVVDACDEFMTALSGDFSLGGNARNVDLLGAQGTPLSARAGYQTIDKNTYRVLDITIPIIVNDAFTQGA